MANDFKDKLLLVHTGNIIGELKRKTTLNATEELLECLGVTLEAWASETVSKNDVQNQTIPVIHCRNDTAAVKVTKDERHSLKLTVKVLLNTFESADLIEAVKAALEELDVSFIESVIIAFPPTNKKLSLAQIRDTWTALENLVLDGLILTIGISDLDTELLIELYNWANVKPSINQVNLASCCVIPAEMQAFAKEHDIQLLTHNDPKEILPKDDLQQLMSKTTLSLPTDGPTCWRYRWIVRYSVLVKCRGLIQNKGFVACLQQAKH